MKNPLLKKQANGWTTPIQGDKRYDGYYPEAVGGKWNPSNGNDISSSLSKQCGGYMGGTRTSAPVQDYIDNTYRVSQDIWSKDKDSEHAKAQTVPMVQDKKVSSKSIVASYNTLAKKFARLAVKTATIRVSQAEDKEGPYTSIDMEGTEYMLRGEDADSFRREYNAIQKPQDKVNALVQKYLDKMQPYPIQYRSPREEPATPAEAAPVESPSEPKAESKPSRWKNWLLNRKEKPYIQTLGLDGIPAPRKPQVETPAMTGIERHNQEEGTTPEPKAVQRPTVSAPSHKPLWPTPPTTPESTPPPSARQPVRAPEVEAPRKSKKFQNKRKQRKQQYVNNGRRASVEVGQRRSSVEKGDSAIPNVVKLHGLATKWAMEATEGRITLVAGKYAVRSDADSITRRMAKLANKGKTS